MHDIGGTPKHLGFQPVTPEVLGYSGISADGGAVWVDSGFAWTNHDPEAIASPCSIEMWVWLLANTQSVRFLFDFGGATSTGIDLALSNADHFGADWNAGHVTGPSATPLTWHHLVATYANPTLTLYVDGASAGTAVVASAGGSSRIVVGNNAAFSQAFSAGAICEVAEYNAALSAARVLAHFNAQEYTGAPVWAGTGLISSSGSGSVGFNSSLLTAIYAAVHKVFPTT